MLYGIQLMTGSLYSNDVFTRSGRTGRARFAIAYARCDAQLDDILAYGFAGLQRYLWYAALSRRAVIFANQPGTADDDGTSWSDYWHGSGMMPVQKQEGNRFCRIFCIGEEHPTSFVRLCFPQRDLRHASGGNRDFCPCAEYLALWWGEKLVSYNDRLKSCERRTNTFRAAFFRVLSSWQESKSFTNAFPPDHGVGCEDRHPAPTAVAC